MLRYANEIELLDVVPRIKLLNVPPQKFDFLTFEEFSRGARAAEVKPRPTKANRPP